MDDKDEQLRAADAALHRIGTLLVANGDNLQKCRGEMLAIVTAYATRFHGWGGVKSCRKVADMTQEQLDSDDKLLRDTIRAAKDAGMTKQQMQERWDSQVADGTPTHTACCDGIDCEWTRGMQIFPQILNEVYADGDGGIEDIVKRAAKALEGK